MADVVCIGSAHTDIFVDVSENIGIDRRGKITISVGGTAYNIACDLKKLGADVEFCTALKENSMLSAIVLYKAKESGLSIENIVLDSKIKDESGFVAFRKNGDLVFAVNSTPIEALDISYLVKDNSLCVIDLNNSLKTIKNILKQHKAYIACVSESKAVKLLDILTDANLVNNIIGVFMNRFEKEKIIEHFKISDINTLSANYPNIIFVVTKDKYGVDVWQNREVYSFAPAVLDCVEDCNFSGAGDAFAAGFVYAKEFLGKNGTSAVIFANKFVADVISKQSANAIESNVLMNFNEIFFTDSLTGLYNRHYLSMYLDTHVLNNCALISFDIDHFKKINDTYGHDVGDAALKTFADILMQNSRTKTNSSSDDIVIRMGGEEFLVIVKNGSHGHKVAERIRKATENNVINLIDGKQLKFTVSAGLVNVRQINKQNFDSAYKKADEALYAAKNSGRNTIVAVEENT